MQGKEIDYGALKSFHFFLLTFTFSFIFYFFNKLVEKSFFCTKFLMERKFFSYGQETRNTSCPFVEGSCFINSNLGTSFCLRCHLKDVKACMPTHALLLAAS